MEEAGRDEATDSSGKRSPDVVPSIASTSVLHFIDAVSSTHGSEVVAAAFERLAPAVRAEIESLAPLAWTKAQTMAELVEALAECAGVTPEALVDQCVRVATRTSFNTVWRILIKLTTAEALVARTPMIYAKSRNVGVLTVVSSGDGEARLELGGYPEVSERQLLALAVSIETILDMTGRRRAQCRWAKSADGGTFSLTWGPRSA
jgi:hypothetical protein